MGDRREMNKEGVYKRSNSKNAPVARFYIITKGILLHEFQTYDSFQTSQTTMKSTTETPGNHLQKSEVSPYRTTDQFMVVSIKNHHERYLKYDDFWRWLLWWLMAFFSTGNYLALVHLSLNQNSDPNESSA